MNVVMLELTPLPDEQATNRNEAMVAAYRSGAYTMAEIAAYFNVHYMTVSRAVRAAEEK